MRRGNRAARAAYDKRKHDCDRAYQNPHTRALCHFPPLSTKPRSRIATPRHLALSHRRLGFHALALLVDDGLHRRIDAAVRTGGNKLGRRRSLVDDHDADVVQVAARLHEESARHLFVHLFVIVPVYEQVYAGHVVEQTLARVGADLLVSKVPHAFMRSIADEPCTESTSGMPSEASPASTSNTS